MSIEPVESQQSPERRLSGMTGKSVVALSDRRPDARRRQDRRNEVRRLTIRETFGRTWEQDNGPAVASGTLTAVSEWRPRR